MTPVPSLAVVPAGPAPRARPALALLVAVTAAERLRPGPGRAGRAARRHGHRRDRGRHPETRPRRHGPRDHACPPELGRRRRRLRLPAGRLHRLRAALLRPDVRPGRPAARPRRARPASRCSSSCAGPATGCWSAGAVDLTTVSVDKADFQLKISFPGEVLETNGEADVGHGELDVHARARSATSAPWSPTPTRTRPSAAELDALLARARRAGRGRRWCWSPAAPATRRSARRSADPGQAADRRRRREPEALHQLGRRRGTVERVEVQPLHALGEQPAHSSRGDVHARGAERHRVVGEALQPRSSSAARQRRAGQLRPAVQGAHAWSAA